MDKLNKKKERLNAKLPETPITEKRKPK